MIFVAQKCDAGLHKLSSLDPPPCGVQGMQDLRATVSCSLRVGTTEMAPIHANQTCCLLISSTSAVPTTMVTVALLLHSVQSASTRCKIHPPVQISDTGDYTFRRVFQRRLTCTSSISQIPRCTIDRSDLTCAPVRSQERSGGQSSLPRISRRRPEGIKNQHAAILRLSRVKWNLLSDALCRQPFPGVPSTVAQVCPMVWHTAIIEVCWVLVGSLSDMIRAGRALMTMAVWGVWRL